MLRNQQDGSYAMKPLRVDPISQIGGGADTDWLTAAGGAVAGAWYALLALASTTVTVVTTSIKTLNGTPQVVGPANLVVGETYTIVSLGTANWALVGAPANYILGTQFTASGTTTGTGSAAPDHQTYAGIVIPVGSVLYGSFQSVQITSGGGLQAFRG